MPGYTLASDSSMGGQELGIRRRVERGGAHFIGEQKLRLLRQRLPLTLLKCAPAGLVELIFLPRATTPPSGACDLDPGAASFQTAFDMQ